MALTYIEAKDEMLTMLQTAWNAQAAAIVTYIPIILYQGIEPKNIQPSDKYFGKCDIFVLSDNQKTLSTNVGQASQRRYNNKGILQLQIMCPLSDVQNSDRGAKLANIAKLAFRGKQSPCGIVFYNAMYTPSLSTEVFSKHIMTVEYNFDEIG